MRSAKVLALLLCASLLLGFAGCNGNSNSGAATASGKTDKMLNVVTSEDISTMDVQKTTAYYLVPLNIYDRLVESTTVDGKPQLVPGLADTWDVSDDGLTYTFHLHEGVKFHNGEILKADDVLYTITRIMTPDESTVNTDFFNMILGAQEYFDGEADSIEGVKVIDDLTVEITLAYPFGAFLANLATPPGSIYNRKATEEAGADFGVDPSKTIGTGPFIASDWKINDRVVLLTNPDYWRGAAKIDGINYINVPEEETQRMMFENGELDVFDASYAPSQLEYFRNSDKWKDLVVSGPEAGLYFYMFNVAKAPYDDINVREAIAYAIDRQTILDQLYNGIGVVTDCMVVEGVYGHNENFPKWEYSLEKAKESLAKSGYDENNRLAIEIIMVSEAIGATEGDMNIAIQSDLKKIGIDVTITTLDRATYYARRDEGNLDMERAGWWVDYNDPDNFLATFFAEAKSKHYSINYYDSEVLQLLEDARREVDEVKRIEMYQQAELIIINRDHVIIPMFQLNHYFVLQPYVKNFQIAWNGWSDMLFYSVEIDTSAG